MLPVFLEAELVTRVARAVMWEVDRELTACDAEGKLAAESLDKPPVLPPEPLYCS